MAEHHGPGLEARDERFWEIVAPDAGYEILHTGMGITEGIVWHPRDQYLIFSDLSASIVYRWTEADGLALIRKPSNITNGNTLDNQGRLISCEHATSCVSRLEADGRHMRVLASHYQGKELNSPNDIIVDSRDRIWFTDPHYGRTNPRVGIIRPQDLSFQGVYRIEADGGLTLIADDFDAPNGLCLTPDETALLADDSNRGHIRRFDVLPDGKVMGGQVFAEIGVDSTGKPDGMKVDRAGRVYCTGPGGIHVLTPDGAPLGRIMPPGHVRNFCFGGKDARMLYMAIHGGICRLPLLTPGVQPRIQ